MTDGVEMANANEGADPTDDIKKQNPEPTGGGADNVAEDDPKKAQKLAKAGEPEVDPDAGQE